MTIADLKQMAILQGIEDDVLKRLAAALEEERFEAGQRLFAEGDPGGSMYLIVEGLVRVEKAADATGALTKTLSILGAGECLGEMSLFEPAPRSAAALAGSRVRVLRLSRAAFEELLRENPTAAVGVLSGMIRTANERIRRLNASVVAYDEIGKAIGESKNLQQLLAAVLRHLCQALQAAWGLLLLKPQFTDRLEARCAEGITLTAAQQDDLSEGKGLLSSVLERREELLVRDWPAQAEFKACGRLGFESPSMVLAPILVDPELLGIIVLGHQTAGQFDLNHLNLVKGVARQAAQAILNARHKEEEESRARLGRKYVRF